MVDYEVYVVTPSFKFLTPKTNRVLFVVHDHIPVLDLCADHISAQLSGKTSLDPIYDFIRANPESKLFFDSYDIVDFVPPDIGYSCADIFFLADAINHNGYNTLLDEKNISKNFVFLANKPRPNRTLVSSWIAENCECLDYEYTSPALDEFELSELLLHSSFELPGKKYLDKKFHYVGMGGDKNKFDNNQTVYGNGNNFNAIKHLFESATLSIVTEPSFYEKGSIFSEKTLQAMLSGHMVIWPGNWKAARALSEYGFDTFDDILDHSYQYIENPVDRTLACLELNRDVIFNKQLQQDFYNSNISRFQHNLDLCLDTDRLQEILHNRVDNYILETINTLDISY